VIIVYNIFKVLYNIGHIIYYKTYMTWLKLGDIEIPFPLPYSTMKNPKPIDTQQDYKPYDGPVCETP